jgi:hypothetical protein
LLAHAVAIVESVTAQDTPDAGAAIEVVLEVASASDVTDAQRGLAVSDTEYLSSGDSSTTTFSVVVAAGEGGAVDVQASVQLIAQVTQLDAGVAGDQSGETHDTVASLMESGTAGDSSAAVVSTGAAMVESGAAQDGHDTGFCIWAAALTESGGADSSTSTTASMFMGINEAGGVADTHGGTYITLSEVLELLQAIGTPYKIEPVPHGTIPRTVIAYTPKIVDVLEGGEVSRTVPKKSLVFGISGDYTLGDESTSESIEVR